MVIAHLDLPTLLVVSAVGIAFAGLTLILAGWRDSNARALAVWASAMFVAACGFMVIAAGPLSRTWDVITGDAILVVSSGLCWVGARLFGGRPANAVAAIAAIGPAFLLGLAAWQREATDLHLVLTLTLVGSYTIAAAETIRRDRIEPLRSRTAGVALLLFHAAFQWSRALSIALAPEFCSANTRNIYAAVFLEALLFAMGMSSVLLSMMKEQAEHRSTVQLRKLTVVDELTGLGNRRQFDDALNREARQAALLGHQLALLMIDVDHFKLYNDTYGHLPGDDCLRAIAGAISRVVRKPADVAARYGGEEFAVLLAATDESTAMQAADRIHASVAALRIEHANSPYGTLTISVGVAAISPGLRANPSADLVRQADWALYVAKSEGRNATRAASESKDSGVLRPLV